ncbi:MAG: tRNA (adenosine(37)-N6)-threonylcarbamoyltransferase complex dimerization subunit type 1 TsaB [Alistipes sp.]|nr:tRNA (adenosine(37)-N6)-threonylcarbamoyltransferase complex dimerization subunit type 1 TsaB [Alistipes sp.]
MALILCIEAGTDIGSVALSKNRELLSLRENIEGKQHAQNLAVYVQEILREHDLDLSDLDAVAVGKGPGSYTGLRIAVSLAKGICYGSDIPLIAVNSLEALAHVAVEDFEAGILDLESIEGFQLLPMIDARRMEVYCQLFDEHIRPLSEVSAHILTPESFLEARQSSKGVLLFGNGAAKSKSLFPEETTRFIEVSPSARGLVTPAYEAFKAKKFENVAYFEPFYLKNFVVNRSTKKIF